MSVAAVMEPETALALIGDISLPASYIAQEVTDVLAKIKESVAAQAEGLDISTEKGRAGIRSLARKIAETKVAMDEHGKALVADLKAQTGLIDAERRRVRDELDALKAEVRQPLTDYEEAEKERVRLHECALLEIQDVRKTGSALGIPSAAIAEAIEALAPYKARDWQEFAKRAETALSIAAEDLEFRHKAAVKAEAEAAELAKLRAEAEERQKIEREKQIAAEAAEKARREADEKAEAERQAAAEALRKEREAAAAREAEIERKRQQAELDRIAAENAIKRAEEQRIADAVEATRREAAAAAQAKRDQEAAIEAERKRVAKIAEDEEKARQQREQNRAHRAKINRAALAAMVNEGIPEEWAKAAIEAIAQAKVPAISISY